MRFFGSYFRGKKFLGRINVLSRCEKFGNNDGGNQNNERMTGEEVIEKKRCTNRKICDKVF